ncbi:hypothetical protein [Methylocapsa aurea]|uniref:hypothetical protein n=1 Tax=Methylocapsa aurea TaxID=663610 RepID=UPI00138DFA4F|nr:hypothetical protein [Methylocapsa aurea]
MPICVAGAQALAYASCIAADEESSGVLDVDLEKAIRPFRRLQHEGRIVVARDSRLSDWIGLWGTKYVYGRNKQRP